MIHPLLRGTKASGTKTCDLWHKSRCLTTIPQLAVCGHLCVGALSTFFHSNCNFCMHVLVEMPAICCWHYCITLQNIVNKHLNLKCHFCFLFISWNSFLHSTTLFVPTLSHWLSKLAFVRLPALTYVFLTQHAWLRGKMSSRFNKQMQFLRLPENPLHL